MTRETVASSRMNWHSQVAALVVAAMALIIGVAVPVSSSLAQTGASPALSGDQIVERVSPAVVLILAGAGDGQVAAVGSGLIVRSDGVLLTANHVVKGMRELQVRLKSGDVYDRVELVASDERRDIAALRIPAVGLTVLPMSSSAEARAGSPVFVVSNGAGLPWTATAGVLSATRMAEEVPGAGSGYRLLQFTAPLAPGSSGGVLVDSQARALGIVVGFVTPGQNVNFAVPADSVAGLASVSGGTPFASGARLRLPGAPAPGIPSAPVRNFAVPPPASQYLPRPEELQIRTVSVHSKTIFMRRERLLNELQKNPVFRQLAVRFVDYGETADVAITVDRPFLTFDWTYALAYQPNGLTLASGTIEAIDDLEAGPKLAAQIAEQLAAAAVLPRAALTGRRATQGGREVQIAGPSPRDSTQVLRMFRTMFVESHTIYLKGNLLQDALYVRPELREWEIKIVDDRNAADLYIDVTRPFLTFDWVYEMVDLETGTVVGKGKVIAWDGPIAAPQLAAEIVKRIRSARPLPSAKDKGSPE